MTEDEAKTKWCPQARVGSGDSGLGCLNRDYRQGCAIQHVNCIGSACMAWRATAPVRLMRTDSLGSVEVATGYCGLAGAPQ